jgi:hypothetical protein
LAATPLNQLHGVSAIGTRLSFYILDETDRTIDPPGIVRHPTLVNAVASANRWDTDLLTAEGENHLQILFDSIRAACDGVPNKTLETPSVPSEALLVYLSNLSSRK